MSGKKELLTVTVKKSIEVDSTQKNVNNYRALSTDELLFDYGCLMGWHSVHNNNNNDYNVISYNCTAHDTDSNRDAIEKWVEENFNEHITIINKLNTVGEVIIYIEG